MPVFSRSRWSLLLVSVSLLWLILIAILQLLGLRQTIPLKKETIQHDVGCAYTAGIKNRPLLWPITQFLSDGGSASQASRLVLLEDGKPIGQPHAMHDEIRNKGAGNYSHWEQSLYFSALDCTDPRSNGKRYEVSIPMSLSLYANVSWFVVACVFGVLVKTSNNQTIRQSVCFVQEKLGVLFVPIDISRYPVVGGVLLTLLLCATGVFLTWIWNSGQSSDLSVAGVYQISDSMAYWLCSNTLLDMGNFGLPSITGEWCQRRSTYPTFLSSIAWIAQRNIFLTLLAQASIASVAIFVVVRRSATFLGMVGMLTSAALLFISASQDLFTMTMSENAGLIFGCTGVAILLKVSDRPSLGWMAVGVAMVSIAMNARAGALVMLPFLVLWAGIVAHYFQQRIWPWVTAASITVLAGFILQLILVLAVGGNPANSHGNFSYVLYGLSVGGKGWQQVLADHPELTPVLASSDALASKAIYAFAWENLISQPWLFLQGIKKNLGLFVSSGTYGYWKLGEWASLFQFLWWLAWIPLFINRRNPSFLLIALSSVGIVLSAPFLLVDGGSRIFAASVVIDTLQMGLGLSWVGLVLVHGIEPALSPVKHKLPELAQDNGSLETVFIVFILSLLVIPHSILRPLHSVEPIDAPDCAGDHYKVITGIGSGGSLLLSYMDGDQRSNFLHEQVKRTDFIKGIPASIWWRDVALTFQGKSLLLAYQQDKTDSYAPGPYPVFSDQDISAYHGHTVRLCVDKIETREMFGISYRKLDSITILD
ncbi:MAG: hypothetical protein QM706_18530 [Nitrospira sp.]